jgi:hypothetical protein
MSRPIWDKRPTTAMYVQIKRGKSSYFVLIDEYETIEALKHRTLDFILKSKLTIKGYDQPFTIEDFHLNYQSRVSRSNCHDSLRCSKTIRHATTSR